MGSDRRSIRTGHYSPLRYPGGKGKLARFMAEVVRKNGIVDGTYVEPYAGGAAIAWELLLTGLVRRVEINDVSRPVAAFWKSAIFHSEAFCKLIVDTPVSIASWDRAKAIYKYADEHSDLDLAFAFFFLNRTNRSGILNAGIIGGRSQLGNYKIDARYNKDDLVKRIERLAVYKNRITVTFDDALTFLESGKSRWTLKTLVYIDPPYYEKGQSLYLNAYKPEDHADVAAAVAQLGGLKWVVSYDDVRPIHDLYGKQPWLQYTLNYSARRKMKGREAMFFSDGLIVPDLKKPMQQVAKWDTSPSPIGLAPHTS